MEEFGGDHRLWVNLAALGEGNIFSILPQLMKDILSTEMGQKEDGFVDIILPSNEAWQTKIYYKLVEKQRHADSTPKERTMLDPFTREPTAKLYDWDLTPKPKRATSGFKSDNGDKKPSIIRGLAPITWTVSDIAKAGCLLSTPSIPTVFEDEQEMRRVYMLVYDVFRYKSILNQALIDISFFQIFPKLSSSVPQVWLLFYDLYHRSFMKRESRYATLAMSLFESAGMSYTENAVWTQKVKLAAAVSRLRIKHNALSLSDLLPPHLRDERVTEQARNNPLTCWINPVKVKDLKKLSKSMEKHLGVSVIYDIDPLECETFKWDRHCPEVVAFHPSLRTRLARSRYVRHHMLIVQDRSFCLGPATFTRVLMSLQLTGDVIQTHVNSPRTTAYLATLLARNDKINKLMVFSAGKRKTEYENYFKDLGVTNVEIFVERFIDILPDDVCLEEVVAVFATPPNSYSAVSDPIDLVCSRGGDLSMLEVLTDTVDTKEARERINSIMEEQSKTLRFSMSRPQIQFILYETHSELEAENSFMVSRSVREMNTEAKLAHAALLEKLSREEMEVEEETEINNETNNNGKAESTETTKAAPPAAPFSKNKAVECDENCDDKPLVDVEVPDTDLFDIPDLPNLCNCDIGKHCQKEGCYLALVKRKKVIQMNDKHMIQMAESRGLFGRKKGKKSGKGSKKRIDKSPEKLVRLKRKLNEEEIERIAAPTHTFLRHIKNSDDVEPCRKVDMEEERKPTIYRSWWKQTARHILALKQSLVKQKLIPSPNAKNTDAKSVVDTLSNKYYHVDEVIAQNNECTRIPAFPKLKLPRVLNYEKVQVPMHVTSVQFPTKSISEWITENDLDIDIPDIRRLPL